MKTSRIGVLMMIACTTLSAAVAWAQPITTASKPPAIPGSVVIERNVEYGRANGKPLLLDIACPKQAGEKPLPAVVYIHGGGWRSGNKGDLGFVLPLVTTGNFVGASIDYRLSDEATWPAQIHDCKAAIRWLKANAKTYHVDPEKIGVWGVSAGGHLVAMLGTTADVPQLEGDSGSPGLSSRVACVVDFCGPTDFVACLNKEQIGGRGSDGVAKLLGGPLVEKRDLAKAASPLAHVSKSAAPFLIVHGTDDRIVPFGQSERFYAALKQAGVDARLIRVLGGGHAGNGTPEVRQRVRAFFDQQLRGQPVQISEESVQPSPPAKK